MSSNPWYSHKKLSASILTLQPPECAHKRNTSSEEQRESLGILQAPGKEGRVQRENTRSLGLAGQRGLGEASLQSLGAKHLALEGLHLLCSFSSLEGSGPGGVAGWRWGNELESSRSRKETEQKTFTSSRSDPSRRQKRA